MKKFIFAALLLAAFGVVGTTVSLTTAAPAHAGDCPGCR